MFFFTPWLRPAGQVTAVSLPLVGFGVVAPACGSQDQVPIEQTATVASALICGTSCAPGCAIVCDPLGHPTRCQCPPCDAVCNGGLTCALPCEKPAGVTITCGGSGLPCGQPCSEVCTPTTGCDTSCQDDAGNPTTCGGYGRCAQCGDNICAAGIEDCGTCPGDCTCPSGQACANHQCRSTTCDAPGPPTGGSPSTYSCSPLQIHPLNHRYFVDGATGGAVLIASYMNIRPTRTYRADIKFLTDNGLHFARVWHLGGTNLWPWKPAAGTTATCGDVTTKYLVGTATTEPQWDITPTTGYWDRMNDALSRASQSTPSPRCITSEVMLFDHSSMNNATDWIQYPWAWQRAKGFTSADSPSCAAPDVSRFYTFASSAVDLVASRDAYVWKMVSETNGYNVVYEVENEHADPGTTWPEHFSALVKASDPNCPRRLVSYNSIGASMTSDAADTIEAATDPNVDIINRHFGQLSPPNPDASTLRVKLSSYNAYLTNATRRAWDKPINIDEFANSSSEAGVLRALGWTIVTSGGHFHLEENNDDQTRQTSAVSMVKNIAAFVHDSTWNFIGSNPVPSGGSPGPSCTVPASGASGTADYVCYYWPGTTIPSSFIVQEDGTYDVKWWDPSSDPASGSGWAVDGSPRKTSGQKLSLPAVPASNRGGSNDWVLLLRLLE